MSTEILHSFVNADDGFEARVSPAMPDPYLAGAFVVTFRDVDADQVLPGAVFCADEQTAIERAQAAVDDPACGWGPLW